ncbi:MAG: hypothetical protein HYT80_00195 [Euryarchaeota archaeon]|nr:hypothetical protein [Euryarchaeota archaeon]
MHPHVRYVLTLFGLLAAIEVVVFLYPPWIESIIPRYYIHYEVWIPLSVGLHIGWLYWAVTRWRRLEARSASSQ